MTGREERIGGTGGQNSKSLNAKMNMKDFKEENLGSLGRHQTPILHYQGPKGRREKKYYKKISGKR